MHQIEAEPLSARAFAPFGEVMSVPAEAGRNHYGEGLASLRPAAPPRLSLATLDVVTAFPLTVTKMERHEFSSQSFVPLTPARYLVVVAPHQEGETPDVTRARAFVAAAGQGITYGPNVWHHPMSVLDAPASFATFIFADGSDSDEEFVDVAPFTVGAPR